jgi:hypothetical protein
MDPLLVLLVMMGLWLLMDSYDAVMVVVNFLGKVQ